MGGKYRRATQTKNFLELDLGNLIDEVESLGKRDKRELKSRLITLELIIVD